MNILERINIVIVMALLFLAIFALPDPNHVPTLNSHDVSAQAGIEFFTLHGFSYGKDVIQNVGPLGFLNYPQTYSGLLTTPKLILNLFLTSYFVSLLVTSIKNIPILKKIIFLIVAALFTSITETMLYFLLFLLLQQLFVTTKWQNLLLPVFTLSILTLVKSTCFFIACSIVLTSLLSHLLCRRFQIVFCLGLFFCFFVLFFWVSCGQSITNFINFVYATLMFSSGYNEAMSIFEVYFIRLLGMSVLLGSALSILLNNLKQCSRKVNKREVVKIILLTMAELFILFIVWKHGFVRADAHVLYFFQYAMLSTIWIIFNKHSSLQIRNRKDIYIPLNLVLILSISAACFVGLNFWYDWSHVGRLVHNIYRSIERKFFVVLDLGQYKRFLRSALQENIVKMQLPKTKALVENRSIGYFGMLPGPLFYNKLNYLPTPATISFASWNSWIMNTEAKFFANDKFAPAYLLFNLTTIDNRLVAQDDSLAQLEIFHRYVPIGSEAGNLILRRNNNVQPLTINSLLREKNQIGEWVKVPQNSYPEEVIWLKVAFKQSLLASLISLIYKPPQYSLEVLLEDGSTKKFKFIPGMAKTGFLLNPLIINNSDVLAIHSQLNELKKDFLINNVSQIKINCDVLTSFCAHSAFLEFNAIQNLLPKNNITLEQYLNSPYAKNTLDSFFDKSNIRKVTHAEQCEGAIDTINRLPVFLSFFAKDLLSVEGWLAKSIEPQAKLPESVLLVLTDDKGKNTFIKTKVTSRTDVGEAFKNSTLNATGYKTIADVSNLQGSYRLRLAYTEKNVIKICPQFVIPGTFGSEEITDTSVKTNSQRVSIAKQCMGSIDEINDLSPAPMSFKVNKLLKVRGWLAKSIEPTAELPGSVLLVLTDNKGKNFFIETRPILRPDVGAAFKNSLLDASGYMALTSLSGINGDYTLSLAYTEGEQIKICPQFKIPGTVKSGFWLDHLLG